MKFVFWVTVGLLTLAAAAMIPSDRDADAIFHLMRVHAVVGGAGGNANIQYVELRMTAAGQNVVNGQIIRFYNATGNVTATFTFPTDVPGAANGSSILIGTSEFGTNSTVAADFTFMASNMSPTTATHPVNAGAGRVCFVGSADCVAYGNFTGSNAGFGSPAERLPSDGHCALTLTAPTGVHNNLTEYSLETAAPRNNAGTSGTLTIAENDDDDDCVGNGTDNCISTPNGPDEASTAGVGDQTNTDQALANAGASITGDAFGNACDTDDDNDTFSDVVETAIGTTVLDNCIGGPGPNGDAWPLDNTMNGVANVTDVSTYKGKIPAAVDETHPKRLDLDNNGVLNVTDVNKYKGKIPAACG